MQKKQAPQGAACPCASGQAYADCCARWHHGPLRLRAPDAQALMRSRYSAYVLGEADYLLATWHPSTRPSALDVGDPALKWLGLEIKAFRRQDTENATVEFVARSRYQGRGQRLHETSRFVREGQQWFYLDGDIRD